MHLATPLLGSVVNACANDGNFWNESKSRSNVDSIARRTCKRAFNFGEIGDVDRVVVKVGEKENPFDAAKVAITSTFPSAWRLLLCAVIMSHTSLLARREACVVGLVGTHVTSCYVNQRLFKRCHKGTMPTKLAPSKTNR